MPELSPPQPATPAPAGEATPSEWVRRRLRWTPKRVLLLVLGVLVFLAISAVVARFFSVDDQERDADLALIQAEARGDVAAMASQLSGCSQRPACVARLRKIDSNPRVRRPGSIKILDLESATGDTLTAKTGPSRVAWTVIGTLPVVQCVEVKRTGNFLTGIDLQLLSISPPIQNEAEC